MILFYCGLGNTTWNNHPVVPGEYACISPVTGRTIETRSTVKVFVPESTVVLQDSGAFSDSWLQRLSCEDALRRQERHASHYGYFSAISHRVSYDLLIDEKWIGGVRYKARWSEQDAWSAVDETVKAAKFLDQHRNGIGCVMSAQGVSARQYVTCVERILPSFRDGDIFGLGGWCITGILPKRLLPSFSDTMRLVIPFLAREGVKRVHIFGVCYGPALAQLLYLCNHYGLCLSTDSAMPSYAPCRGKFGYAEWRQKGYVRPVVQASCLAGRFDECCGCLGLERARHVAMTRRWLMNFEESRSYKDFLAGRVGFRN